MKLTPNTELMGNKRTALVRLVTTSLLLPMHASLLLTMHVSQEIATMSNAMEGMSEDASIHRMHVSPEIAKSSSPKETAEGQAVQILKLRSGISAWSANALKRKSMSD